MPSLTLAQLDFDENNEVDQDSLATWLCDHYVTHVVLRNAASANGAVAGNVDFSVIYEPRQWLQDHQVEHSKLASVFGTGAPPSMTGYDLSNQSDVDDFLNAHYLEHQKLAIASGTE